MIPFDISVSGTVLKYVKPEYNPINAAQAPPLPDWYFLFIYFFYKAIDPSSASIIFLGWVAVTVLFPFIDAYVFRHKAPHPGLRPAAVSLGTGFIIAFIVNTIWAEETPGQEIGTIGLVVDAIIFIACFAVLWPLLRYVVQPRVLAKMSSSPFRDGGIMTIKPEKRVLSGALVLSMNLFILGTLIYSLYQALTIPMTSLANQFIIGQYIGLSMIMFSLSIFLNVVIGYGKR